MFNGVLQNVTRNYSQRLEYFNSGELHGLAERGLSTMQQKAVRKVRIWGPAKGGGVKSWRGAVVVPERIADAMLLNLDKWHTDGRIGAYHFKRLGFLGMGGAAVWVGRVKKASRPCCGAKTRKEPPCLARVVAGAARCRLHGGLSTGPKTADGRARICESNRRRAELRRSA